MLDEVSLELFLRLGKAVFGHLLGNFFFFLFFSFDLGTFESSALQRLVNVSFVV